jgi:hypothetical protein
VVTEGRPAGGLWSARAVPSDKGREQAVRSEAAKVVGALGNIRFVNHGPSGSAGGRLIFRIAGNVFVQTAWAPDTLHVTPPPIETKSLEVDWQIIPAGFETDAANNSFSHTFLICGRLAKQPECANAK